jgi:hypothetical protein
MASCQSVLLRFLGWDGEAFIFAMSRTCGKAEKVNTSASRPGGAEKEGQLWNRCDRDYDDAPKGVCAFGVDWRISRGSRRNASSLTF